MSRTDLDKSEPHLMSRLMELNDKPQALWQPAELGEILTHQLSMPAAATSFDCAIDPASSPTNLSLRQLLEDPLPPVDLLNTIRRAAKSDCSSTSALLPREVALVIYYASIATGLVQLSKRISNLDDNELSQAFNWSLKRQWLDRGLVPLFENAMALLATSLQK